MLVESFTGAKALFIGNGINRTESNFGISWIELLKKISRPFGISTDLDNELKPFPLSFEEMLYSKPGKSAIDKMLRNLKKKISEILTKEANKLIDDEIHKGIMQCGIKEIVTTNYDYNLEKSVSPDFMNNKSAFSIDNSESKLSLYRGYKINEIKVRHIHGELNYNRKIFSDEKSYLEESIMIGFEHYSDYFMKIQRIVKGERGRHKDTEKKSLLIRLRDKNFGDFWTDLFFTHQLIFAGFSLDFSETHLWWLLLYREELRRNTNVQNMKINNEIIFCIPQFSFQANDFSISDEKGFNQVYKKKLAQQKNSGVSDILKALGIIIQPINCNSFRDFYLKVIDMYQVK